MGCASKGLGRCVAVTITGFGHAVVRGIRDQRRIGLQRIGQGDDARQLFKVDLHRFSSVTRLLLGVCHHRHDGLAHITHAVNRQNMPHGRGRRRSISACKVGDTWHGRATFFDQLLTSYDQLHTRHGLCSRGVDRQNACMWIGRSDKVEPGLARQFHVVGVEARTFEQLLIFQSKYSVSAAKSCRC